MSDDKTKVVGILDNPKYNEMTSRVYDDQGIAPTIQTMDGGGKEPKIRTICLNPKIDGKQPGLNDRVYSTEGVATAVTTFPFFMGNIAEGGESHMRIRKLTEGECLRLQGFQKRDKEAMAEAGLTKSVIYHSAGDSITTTCLVGLMGVLLGVDTTKAINDYADELSKEEK